MRKTALFLALLFLSLLSEGANVTFAAPTAGTSCAQLGKTIIADNHMNIMTCVCKSTPNCPASDYVWKSMVVDILTNGTFDCPAGYALVSIIDGVASCAKM
ncbi:MAG: hypothetical protein WC464_04120 [Bdellovibrionales bacterium]